MTAYVVWGLQGYRLVIEVGPDIAGSATLQAAVLTAVNTGRRCFLGGVLVVGDLAVRLLVPWRRSGTLAEAVVDLQGQNAPTCPPDTPRIVIGDAGSRVRSPCSIRATFEGWSGGVIPLEDTRRLAEQQEFIPSGVLAGALAVAEAFQFVRGGNAQAGRRAVGLSLWRPEASVSWLEGADPGPALELLPVKLWLIGLGHLGQAYLWMLGLLPYAHPEKVTLVLQDTDVLVEANDSTSLLTTLAMRGEKKTRAMARWCEERGFHALIQERRFAANFHIAEDEPQVALCGVDNPQARAALEEVGFQQIIEVGLGHGTQEYLAFQLHTFPARRSARVRWEGETVNPNHERLLDQPAYQDLASNGLEQCGLTLLAGRSVGASFVGAITAALVIAELARMILGVHRYEIIDGSLRSLMYRRVVESNVLGEPYNPGYTRAWHV